ncbi:MAG: hypothetical protein Q4B31_01385 [Clostridia bacterium]|nr:hypothetical protein [Clostridia bacterium]
MKILKKAVLILLSVMLIQVPFTGFAKTFEDELLDKGFPESYIPMITKLHEEHPNWNFEPLNITELKSTYTWDYVIGEMMEKRDRNLVIKASWAPSPFNTLGDANYSPYRDESLGAFDSGAWYAATEDAIKYFMDPRNFLNDKDCFMFLDWSYDGRDITVSQIESVLGSSKFTDKVIPDLDGETTYAEYILETGKELGVDPMFLAARLVQENGTGDSPMVSGTAGDYLEIPEYNGFFNLYNISAGGNGYDTIYKNGIERAIEGTPEMAEEWGGSPSWDTTWKAIYGGIVTIRDRYVKNYKNTLYMQKFNTDPRGTNTFSGYMQNIAAPLTEGRTFRKAVYNGDAMENAYTFKIPVYEGMDFTPYADPGMGETYYSYSKLPEQPIIKPPVTDENDEWSNPIITGDGEVIYE